ncbi:PRD domain-containing protein [Clostridium grantii]|uniref:Transcriptional antiterminator, BglG family n=1 Tax=Clostridium grantii DSM 8605 TaxID=1121316 RepID=A0A1M5QM89_9CLOT|nr:PRD domain-containing protein [Clostridium grantii]SHH15066.1 transcriptional antiterminator, BglG family [Clostridium grantii DSM 8605]
MYTIKKILNNNVVVAIDNKREELILVGNGIGFQHKKGDMVLKEEVLSIYIKEKQDLANNYQKVLSSIDSSVVGISEEIISLWEKEIDEKLNNSIHISLPDHINFALKRYNSGVKIENPFLMELKILFPKEFDLASKALEMINSRFNVSFPEDEIGFISLHVRAAVKEEGLNNSSSYLKNISKIMELISKLLNKQLNKNSFEYIRTVSHINFMYERVKNNTPINNLLLESIKKELYEEFNIALKVAMMFNKLFQLQVPEDEVGYIALHLKRLKDIEGN